jgi:hypothetical protein
MRFKDKSWSEVQCSGKRLGHIVTFTARFDLLDLEVKMKRGGGVSVLDGRLHRLWENRDSVLVSWRQELFPRPV